MSRPRTTSSTPGPRPFPGQTDPPWSASSELVLLSLVPAVFVAWADGEVQDDERAAIRALAQRHGLADDPIAMAQLERWMRVGPSDDVVLTAIRALQQGERGAVARALGWAREVAKANGGFLGMGAVSSDERHTLERLEGYLCDDGGERASPSLRFSAGAVRVMRDLFRDRLAADTTHIDFTPKSECPALPVPSPMNPGRLPPAVFSVRGTDYHEYMDKIIPRYHDSILHGWWDAVRLACTAGGVAPMDDGELSRLVAETPFSRFLTPTLDPVDARRFALDLEQAPAGVVYKLDLSHYGAWTPLPGMQLAPTVGLFSAQGDRLTPLAIAVRGKVIRPGEGESWARARYFLLQGCSTAMVVGVHPFLHFPMDSVIAVTREALAPDHPVARLIEVHAYLHLPLDYGVSWSKQSPAHNHQQEIYTSLAARRDDIFGGIADFYSGVPGNSGYPGFRYPMSAPSFFGPYCRFLSAYYEVVLAHCARVANARPFDDALARWGKALHALLPGFPSPEALSEPDTLARALAGFVHSVSIWHSAEHHVYGLEPVTKVPHRLRVDVPVGGDPDTASETWLHPVDIARQELSRRMFYEAHTVRSILEIDYRFDDPSLRSAQDDFLSALRACDAAQPRRYIALEKIACSLQF